MILLLENGNETNGPTGIHVRGSAQLDKYTEEHGFIKSD